MFFPSTIYAMLQLKKEQCQAIRSNLEYIRLFRHNDRLTGEDDYYLTSVSSAADFIERLSV
jgi:hypothetical protein